MTTASYLTLGSSRYSFVKALLLSEQGDLVSFATLMPPLNTHFFCLVFYFQFFIILGNLPVERAKDAVCFLQWCGVSLVSSYGVWFLQQGGMHMSLASSPIIYNIVKVKVTCWPVDLFNPLTRRPIELFDPLTRRPVDLFEKEPLKAIARSTYIHGWDVSRLNCWPVDPSSR